jgi:hypothetical protein
MKNVVKHFIIEENGYIGVFQERVEEPVPQREVPEEGSYCQSREATLSLSD